jgi:hypothetical protein
MKIIDQTPFYKEKGELSLIDRAKAILKYGADWPKEIEGQKSVITILDKVLDKRYTLIRNFTPPDLDIMIPFILVGPTGVCVMWVTSRAGTFSAKGNEWGSFSGGVRKAEKPNLLTRTEMMARAIQVYLQRQGYVDLTYVEPILLCSDPSTHVDSVRPIIRVVMFDALERFAVSLSQGRAVFNPESVFGIANRILNPAPPPPPKPVEAAAAGAAALETGMERLPPVQDSLQPESESNLASAGFPSSPEGLPESASVFADTPPSPAGILPSETPAMEIPPAAPAARRRRGITRKQAAFLIGMFVVWCLLIAVFVFLILRDQSLLGLTR